jgi:MoxR-like ATPase
VQRSYLLVGEPGTGKTSICYQVAKRMAGRCIKIDNDVINDYEPTALEGLLNYSNAKLIIQIPTISVKRQGSKDLEEQVEILIKKLVGQEEE